MGAIPFLGHDWVLKLFCEEKAGEFEAGFVADAVALVDGVCESGYGFSVA